MINLFILFSLSRMLGQDFILDKLGSNKNKVDSIKKDTGFLSACAWKINPLFPIRFLDLGFGLSRISLKKYFTASLVVLPIRILWLQIFLAAIDKKFLDSFMVMAQNIMQDPTNYQASSTHYVNFFMNYISRNPGFMGYTFFYYGLVIILTAVVVLRRMSAKEKTA